MAKYVKVQVVWLSMVARFQVIFPFNCYNAVSYGQRMTTLLRHLSTNETKQ